MSNAFPLLCFALLSLAAFDSRTGVLLTGKITDNHGDPLIGVAVKASKGTELVRGAITDVNGVYRLDLEPGTYDIEFSYTGFESKRITGVVILAGQTNTLNVELTGGVVLDEVVITAYKTPLVKADETSSGMVLTSESIRPVSKPAPREARKEKNGKAAGKGKIAAKPAEAPAKPAAVLADVPMEEMRDLEKAGEVLDFRVTEADDATLKSGFEAPADGPAIPAPRAGLLTAGEWNDLHNWSRHWTDLMNDGEINSFEKLYGFFPKNRFSVLLQTDQNLPVVDAVVRMTDRKGTVLWESRTDNLGRAELWANLFENEGKTNDLKLVAFVDGQAIEFEKIKPFAEGLNRLKIHRECGHSSNLDIVWTVDATGSMGDELEYLKTELLDVISRVKTANPTLSVRMGSVFYRDQGDEYLVKSSALNHDIAKTVDYIRKQSAGGGGDYPEAVHSALEETIYHQPWNTDAVARICFLVLDASPHQEPAVVEILHKSIREAAKKGIRIVPVSASGIQKDTEFLMKFFGLATNATYVFLTDHSGVGGKHLEPTTDEYKVELLNDLLVRLITEYSAVPSCEGKSEIRFENQQVANGQAQSPENNPVGEPILYYPNPASVQFTLELPFDADKVTLYDAEGKAVRNMAALKAGTYTIAVNDLSEGFYTLRIWKGRQVQSGKVLVVRA